MNLALDLNLRAARMLEQGRVTVTFVSGKTGQHITIRARCRKPGSDPSQSWEICPLAEARVINFDVPNSQGFPDKVARYSVGRGIVVERGADPARVYCAQQLLNFVTGKALPPSLTAMEESRCGRCGHELTDPESIARGIGPDCYGHVTSSQHQQKVSPRPSVTSDASPVTPPAAEPGEDVQLDLSASDAAFRRMAQIDMSALDPRKDKQ